MLCFVALAVFLFLSLFSAKYRPLAARALGCVARKATLRPCDSGLDEELKAASIAGIMRLSPSAASFVNRHFTAFSFAFTLLFFASIIFTLQGAYNFALYGNCNGFEGGACVYSGLRDTLFLSAPSSAGGITMGNASANVTLIEVGCYTCPYTKEAEKGVHEMLEKYGDRLRYVFKAFPLPSHPYANETVMAASCANDEGKYWEYRQLLFQNQSDIRNGGVPVLKRLAASLNLAGFDACMDSGKYQPFVNQTISDCAGSGIYMTPTFFVNGKPFVGISAVNDTEKEVEKLLGE
jgi:protein-disulfide isomerase